MEPLLERARAWFPTLKGCEHDLYQAAWESLLGNSRPIDDPETFLECAVYSAGLKELRRRRRRPVVSLSAARFRNGTGGRGAWQEGVDALDERTAPLPEEQVESREDAWLLKELLEDLTPLQRCIIKLRWGCGVRRREAAALLGISEKSVKREMEKAEPLIARNAELARAGRWCEPKKSLVVAYSLGLLGEGRAAKARQHLRRCPACRALAHAMRDRLDGLAAMLPLPALAGGLPREGLIARAAELGDSIRATLTDVGTGAKEHALAIFARTPGADVAASQVAVGGGLRGGGGALAAVSACLLASGGATYCVIEGVPEPLRDLAPIQQAKPNPSDARGQTPRHEAPVPERPLPVIGSPTPQPVQGDSDSAQPRPDVATERPVARVSPAPSDSVEFGPAPAGPSPTRPATAPSSGGGEFAP
jgi:RNA polymerase sigma factor (sigma-70 family)